MMSALAGNITPSNKALKIDCRNFTLDIWNFLKYPYKNFVMQTKSRPIPALLLKGRE